MLHLVATKERNGGIGCAIAMPVRSVNLHGCILVHPFVESDLFLIEVTCHILLISFLLPQGLDWSGTRSQLFGLSRCSRLFHLSALVILFLHSLFNMADHAAHDPSIIAQYERT